MTLWAIFTPLLFGILLLTLARLEDWVVAPIDRADRISKMLAVTDPDELERAVSEYLAPVVVRRPAHKKDDDDTKPFRISSLSRTA